MSMLTLAGREAAHPSDLHSAHLLIRVPSSNDVPGLTALFSEMQSYYGRPVSDATATAAAMRACSPPVMDFDPRVLIGLMNRQIVGSLVMNVTFPAFELSRSLYIRDLYVARCARRHGVGKALVTAGARVALQEGFSALEWTTETANSAARKMYESCGARQLDRTYYRLFDESLVNAAGESTQSVAR